jgi:N-acetylmuramic acid 6-phosphate (MurNAc-6-P) etherase
MARKRSYTWTEAGTATRTVPLYICEQDGYIQAADYAASGATDGTKTAQLRNQTQAFNITNALTISALAALARTPFVIATTNAPNKKGDVIVIIYTVTVAGTVSPGEVSIDTDDGEPIGIGHGPAWAG